MRENWRLLRRAFQVARQTSISDPIFLALTLILLFLMNFGFIAATVSFERQILAVIFVFILVVTYARGIDRRTVDQTEEPTTRIGHRGHRSKIEVHSMNLHLHISDNMVVHHVQSSTMQLRKHNLHSRNLEAEQSCSQESDDAGDGGANG